MNVRRAAILSPSGKSLGVIEVKSTGVLTVPTLGILVQFIVQLAAVHAEIQALVMTSQMKFALQAQATPKAVATELLTAVLPQVTHVFVMSFHTERGAVAVLQLQLKLPMVTLDKQAKHLA